MAKGRRQHGNDSERLLGSVAFSGDVSHAFEDLPDLAEDDVFFASVFSSFDDNEFFGQTFPDHDDSDPERPHRWPPGRERRVGGLSLAFEDCHDVDAAGATVVHQHRSVETAVQPPRERSVAASAPVNVPAWPSHLRLVSAEYPRVRPPAWPSDDGDDESEWLPPHEYLAREHRKGAMATSVFEGVGRTLKGRDMSRVRDAVWSQTKFYG